MDLQKVTLPLLILDVEKNDTKQALAHVLNQHDAGYQQPFILNIGLLSVLIIGICFFNIIAQS